MRVKCLAQEHNTITKPGLEPRTLDPESSALTTRPPCLPHQLTHKKMKLTSAQGILCVPLCLLNQPNESSLC